MPIDARIPLQVQPVDISGLTRLADAWTRNQERGALLELQERKQQFEMDQMEEAKARRQLYDFAYDQRARISSGDIPGAIQAAEQRWQMVTNKGGDPSHTLANIRLLETDPKAALAAYDGILQKGAMYGDLSLPDSEESSVWEAKMNRALRNGDITQEQYDQARAHKYRTGTSVGEGMAAFAGALGGRESAVDIINAVNAANAQKDIAEGAESAEDAEKKREEREARYTALENMAQGAIENAAYVDRAIGYAVDTLSEAQSEVFEGFNWATGWGSVFQAFPRTQSRALRSQLNTIQSNLAFDRLQEMRNASKTGGALGQVSERELTLLMNAVAALDQAGSAKDLLRGLMDVKVKYQRVVKSMEDMKANIKRERELGRSNVQSPAVGNPYVPQQSGARSDDDIFRQYGVK